MKKSSGNYYSRIIEVNDILYDIEALLEELDISEKEKKDLVKEAREEFPNDDMLFELHLFRAINYLKKLKAEK